MSELTVQEAAERLQVHQSRVRGLIGAGTLSGRRVGRQWLVTTEDVERQEALTRAGVRSRSMSARTAWAAGALVDGQATEWLADSERSRLAARLRGAEGTAIFQRWLAKRHSSVTRYRIADTDIAAFLNETDVVATGLTAARSHGVRLGSTNEAEVYVDDRRLQVLDRTYLLVASTQGNLVVHHTEDLWHLRTQEQRDGLQITTRLMTAVDLLDQTASRSRSTGRDLLLSALEEFRAGTSVPA
jgi:excisionase family DNA binding protein